MKNSEAHFIRLAGLIVSLSITAVSMGAEGTGTAKWEQEIYHSPICLSYCPSRKEIYVCNQTKNSVSVVAVESEKITGEISTSRFPTDARVSPSGKFLYVSSLYDYRIDVIDLATRQVVDRIATGYEPYGVTISEDGGRIFVANLISRTVQAISTETRETLFTTPVGREPRYLVELPGKRRLAVANSLSRDISLLDSETGALVETRILERASMLRQAVVTADEKHLIVAGVIAHDEMVTTQIERGWINSNGLFFVDLSQKNRVVTVPLDSLINGAANPWGLCLSRDHQRLYVSLAGVHEVAYVNLPKMLDLMEKTRPHEITRLSQNVEIFDQLELGRRHPTGGLGPRGMLLLEDRNELIVANFFTNDLSVMDAATGEVKARVPLGPPKEMTLWRKGEMLFCDARLCQQNYYSCASCHQEDATMDGLNWDLINDGRGNPKNAKSLHDAFDSPPAMWSGVRADMMVGVASGQRFLGFMPNEENHAALMEFIGNPRRAPNPFALENPDAAARGEEIFHRARCHACHRAPTFTDGRKHDLGLRAPGELRSRFFTPSLREGYRTGPYLHHGAAESLEEIFTKFNPDDKHGLTSHLSRAEIADLVRYLRTL